MSYDFRLCLPVEGKSPEEIGTSDSDNFVVNEPQSRKEERKKQVAAALIRRNPRFKQFGFDLQENTGTANKTSDESGICSTSIELDNPENENGIQITIFDDEASISVPYWHRGDKALVTFREIWEYIDIMQREGGYFTYDTQIGRVLNLKTDFELVLDIYKRFVGETERVSMAYRKKRWWEFWK